MTGYRATQIRKPSDEQDFEKNVGILFRAILRDPNVKRAGRRGQRQEGVDLIGRRNGKAKRVVGIQCKLKGEGNSLRLYRLSSVGTQVEKRIGDVSKPFCQ